MACVILDSMLPHYGKASWLEYSPYLLENIYGFCQVVYTNLLAKKCYYQIE
jgi:hypothetical protein